MRKPLLSAAAVWVATALVPATGVSQRLPGTPGGDGFSAAMNRAEFFADVMFHTDSLLKEWRIAWAADDAEALLDLYTEDAVIIFEQDAPVRGREAIQAKLASLLEESGEVQVSIGDFDASGRMGMISGLLTVQMRSQTGSRTMTGIHLTVLTRPGRDWKIRSQVIRLGTDTGKATRTPGGVPDGPVNRR